MAQHPQQVLEFMLSEEADLALPES
jgi:hypothetical protein